MHIERIHETLRAISNNEETHWLIEERTGYLLCLTNNYIHQGGFQQEHKVTLRLSQGGFFGWAQTHDTSREGCRNIMKTAREALALKQKGGVSFAGKQSGPQKTRTYKLRRAPDYCLSSLHFSPGEAAKKIARAFEEIKKINATAHGYFSNYEWKTCVGNSAGTHLVHRSTGAKFGLTVNRNEGSGYQTFFHPDVRKIAFEKIAAGALAHACLTERPIEMKPGRYSVILAPRALASFLYGFLEEWNGLRFEERESFLIHRRNQPFASSAWTVWDDVSHPLQIGTPFDVEGEMRKKICLLRSGRFSQVVYDRWTAQKYHRKSTGHALSLSGEEGALPYNIVVGGGSKSVRDMVGNLRRGILIPNIWYHQIVNPSRWTVTGLTRGGAAWIEDGKIVGGLGRIRYLDSLLGALRRTSQISREQAALKVRDAGALVLPYVQIEGLRII